ncbi:transcriptional regulator [Kitasatospora aureofaciens]|uniref:transcriptional regulator n=1 Tax=Kitasatospora aureofaciens TaxID=1894 RepID=UPI0033F4610C
MLALPGTAQARQGIDAALSPMNTGDIAYLFGAVERHLGGYHGRPPVVVLAEMQEDLEVLRDTLALPHRAADRTELARTAAQLAGLVAIIHHDRGDQREAAAWFATAETAAAETGDRRTKAWVLARHAMLPLNYGAPRTAADLAVRARNAAGEKPSAAAALAAAVTARALAGAGDTHGALRAIRDAEHLAEHLSGEDLADTWFGYPAQKHHVHLSQANTMLGRTRAAYAEQLAALALTKSQSVMTRALLGLDEAACQRIDGDHASAADLAVQVWTALPPEHRGGLIRSRTSELQKTLGGGAAHRLAEALAA